MTQLAIALRQLGLDASLLPQLTAFRDLFAKWNERINLSAAATPADIEEHIRDSLHAVAHLPAGSAVIDVGSGGGLPVVVAAICVPTSQFTALEPVHKKHAFLRTAARELHLANLEAFARRVEDHPDRNYGVAMSRATFDLRAWILRGLELVGPAGWVLGFEAVQRDDLPQPFQRHRYELDGKARAIIVATHPTSAG